MACGITISCVTRLIRPTSHAMAILNTISCIARQKATGMCHNVHSPAEVPTPTRCGKREIAGCRVQRNMTQQKQADVTQRHETHALVHSLCQCKQKLPCEAKTALPGTSHMLKLIFCTAVSWPHAANAPPLSARNRRPCHRSRRLRPWRSRLRRRSSRCRLRPWPPR